MFSLILVVVLCLIWKTSYSGWRTRVQKQRPAEVPEPFVYKSLASSQSIRLLRFLPWCQNGMIQLEMIEHQTLPSDHECLSYMWGDESEMHPILVNGQILRIRKNLHDYLSMAAHSSARSHLYLWVDAICINQEDCLERAQQVQRMGDIYREAKGIIIWMGVDGSYSDLIRWIYRRRWTNPSERKIKLLKAFVTHPYWERAWITQEVLLAKTVTILHRTGEVPWGLLGALTQALVEQGVPDAIHAVRTSHAMMLWKWQSDKRSVPGSEDDTKNDEGVFWAILSRRVKSKCMDPRDRIYSLLALDSRAAQLKVDYQEPASGLFWRAGEQLGAWCNPQHIQTLCGALGLDWVDLEESLEDRLNGIVTIPMRQSYLTSPFKAHVTGKMVCQNGHNKHSFPFPRQSHHDILLCPNTLTRTFDDTRHTHAVIQPAPKDDAFTIILSNSTPPSKNQNPLPEECQLRHFADGEWATVTSWSYLRAHMSPEVPSSIPTQWQLRLPMRWVVRRSRVDELASGALVRYPSLESEQFTKLDRNSWFGNEPVKHKLARYVTDAKRVVR